MTPLREFVQQHPWWTGLLVSVLAFVLNGIRRFKAAEARMSNEEKLALRLLRAAMALRKLGRAKRLLSRYVAIRAVAPQAPMPGMIRRLWRADRDAAEAADHLAAVLKQISKSGAPPATLVTLDRRITEAREVRETCRRYVRSSAPVEPGAAQPDPAALDSYRCEAATLLGQVQFALAGWRAELESAAAGLASSVNSNILRSGGAFRNPFQPESAVEDAQSGSVLELGESQRDLHRAEQCATTLQDTLAVLKDAAHLGPKELATLLGKTLDDVDACLAEAEQPLPPALACGELPVEDAGAGPRGLLQRIYELLVKDEVAAWATLAAGI